jgi:hypothetical protein
LTDCPVIAYCLTKTIVGRLFTVLKNNLSSPIEGENYASCAQGVVIGAASAAAQRGDKVVAFKRLIDSNRMEVGLWTFSFWP